MINLPLDFPAGWIRHKPKICNQVLLTYVNRSDLRTTCENCSPQFEAINIIWNNATPRLRSLEQSITEIIPTNIAQGLDVKHKRSCLPFLGSSLKSYREPQRRTT